MGRIVVHEFITLDGVIEAPTWTFDYPFDPKMGEAIGEVMGSSKAILLGRTTYEQFAPAWSNRTAEEDPGAPFMNDSPKYVVSATLQTADWNNSTILGAYDTGTVRSLKDRIDGDIYVSGSGTLARAMLADCLVDGCTCSSSRWRSVVARSCSPTPPPQSSSRSLERTPTKVESSI